MRISSPDRAVVCIVWNGVNSYYGGRLVSVAIKAIWPRWGDLPNALPASAGITSTDMAACKHALVAQLLLADDATSYSLDLHARLRQHVLHPCARFALLLPGQVHLGLHCHARAADLVRIHHPRPQLRPDPPSRWMVKARGVDFTVFPEAKMSTDTKAWLVLQAFNAGLGTASSVTVNQ